MDALRKLLAKAPATTQKEGAKTWYRRGDAEQARKDAYLDEKKKADEARAKKEEEQRQAKLDFTTRRRLLSKGDLAAEEARQKRQKVAEDSHKAATGGDDDDSDADAPIEFEEVCDRLRELDAPITLFGESDMKRYRRLTILELQHQNLTAHAATRADGRGKKRENIGGGDYSTGADLGFGAAAASAGPGASPSPSDGPGGSPRPSDDEADEKDAENEEKEEKEDEEGDDADEEVDERVTLIRTWIRSLMRAWEEDLQARDGDEKRGAAAKAESQQYRQSKQHLRPLLKGMKKGGGALPEIVLARLHEIVQLCDERKYAKANDVYIALAMGNSGFAVGATALQLKERKEGRGGKLDTSNDSRVAHALNDESTRKFIQAFKRLVTQCEQRNPGS